MKKKKIVPFFFGTIALLYCFFGLAYSFLLYIFAPSRKKTNSYTPTEDQCPAFLPGSKHFHREIIGKIANTFYQCGYWPTFVEVRPEGDERYDFKAIVEDFLFDPDLRLSMPVCGILQFFLWPTRRKSTGLAQPMNLQNPFRASMDFYFLNFFVIDQLIQYLERSHHKDKSLTIHVEELVKQAIYKTVENRSVCNDGTSLYCITKSPKTGNKRIEATFCEWGGFPDTDSTAWGSSILQQYVRYKKKTPGFKAKSLLKEIDHVLKSGKTLQHYETAFKPAYDNVQPRGRKYISKKHFAYTTYFLEGRNDADPTVNINILRSFLVNKDNWGLFENSRIIVQVHAILEFIHHLARNGSLFTIYVHQYYPITVFTYLWKRFIIEFYSLSAKKQDVFDKYGLIPSINQMIDEYWQEKLSYLIKDANLYSTFDLLLLKYSFPNHTDTLQTIILDKIKLNNWDLFAEFFIGLYPTKSVFGNPFLTLSFFLNDE